MVKPTKKDLLIFLRAHPLMSGWVPVAIIESPALRAELEQVYAQFWAYCLRAYESFSREEHELFARLERTPIPLAFLTQKVWPPKLGDR